jgi:hypothetical protein
MFERDLENSEHLLGGFTPTSLATHQVFVLRRRGPLQFFIFFPSVRFSYSSCGSYHEKLMHRGILTLPILNRHYSLLLFQPSLPVTHA